MDNNNVALITKMVLEAVEKQKASGDTGYLVPIGVSARHIHLTQEHVEALFGPGYQLTKKKELMGGQFALSFFRSSSVSYKSEYTSISTAATR